MKFFHIADLHFGKMLHDVPLTETDQAFWVEQFLRAVDAHQPDAVVIAGDLYDRRIPGVEAMKLFDRLLTELARREKYVLVIPGNHDSAVRVSHVNALLEPQRIFIAGELTQKLLHVTIDGVTFWLMPYLFPKAVADLRLAGGDALSSYDEAARCLLEAQEIDTSACNILVAHQNVLAHGVKPEHSESETIIGGLGEIDYTAFDAFDYVALGHIHNAQKIGRETVRYAGCPLYYDFSEMSRSKALTMVTVSSKDDITVEMAETKLLHRLLQHTGTLEELLAQGSALKTRGDYYIQCILKDQHMPPRAMDQLREVYGDSLVSVKRERDTASAHAKTAAPGTGVPPGLEEQFEQFYREQADELLDGEQEALVKKILEQQARRGGDCWLKAGEVPQEDSRELLDDLMKRVR